MTQIHADPDAAPDQPARAGAGHRSAAIAGLVCAVLLAAAAVPTILLRLDAGRGAFDEINYHEPAIRIFAAAWPDVDLSDYLSATTPGYHLLMAGLLRLFGPAELTIRAANVLIACALVSLLGGACASRARGRAAPALTGVAVALPMVTSLYVLSSGVWLLPDNLGWLLVLAVLLLALRLSRAGGSVLALIALSGASLAALAFVRQIHLWAAAPLWAGAWLAGGGPVLADIPRRLSRVLLAIAASLPAFALIAALARLWGGLTPPTFHAHFRISPAAPAFVLAVFGVLSVFFLPMLLPAVVALWRERRAVLPAAAAIGALTALIPETAYSMADGRWSGLWNIARVFEERGLVVAGRSPLIAALAAAGAVALAGWVRRIGLREGLVVLAALAAFTAAQAASFQLWQRYTEPFILMLLALLATGGGAAAAAAPVTLAGHPPLKPLPSGPLERGRALAGPLLLAALLGAQSLLTFARAERADYYGFTAGSERARQFFQGVIPEPTERPPRP